MITDPTGIWLDRVLQPLDDKIWSVDGSALKVGGPILTPDLKRRRRHALALAGDRLTRSRANGVRLSATQSRRTRDRRSTARRKAPSSCARTRPGSPATAGSSATGDHAVRARVVQPLRRLRRTARARGRDAVAQTWCPAGATGRATASCGSAPWASAPTSSRDRAADGTGSLLRSGLQPARTGAAAADASRGGSRSRSRRRSLPTKVDPLERRARARSARGLVRRPAALRRVAAGGDEVCEARSGARRGRAGRVRSSGLRERERRPWQRRASAGRRMGALDATRSPAARRSWTTSSTAVLARVEVEDELLVRVARRAAEERRAVARVVDGAEDGRRRDRAGGS